MVFCPRFLGCGFAFARFCRSKEVLLNRFLLFRIGLVFALFYIISRNLLTKFDYPISNDASAKLPHGVIVHRSSPTRKYGIWGRSIFCGRCPPSTRVTYFSIRRVTRFSPSPATTIMKWTQLSTIRSKRWTPTIIRASVSVKNVNYLDFLVVHFQLSWFVCCILSKTKQIRQLPINCPSIRWVPPMSNE